MANAPREKHDVPFATDAEVREMVAGFEACEWPFPRWTHRAHLGVALCYVQQYPFDAALDRARHHIQLYNRTRGNGTGYHETITALFMRRIARYVQDAPKPLSLRDAVEELARRCDMKWVLRHYSQKRLDSPEAAAGWVEPDREPLDY